MKLNNSARRLAGILGIAASLGLAYASAARAADSPPEMSSDGLRLQKDTGTRVIYVRPGAKFGKYDKVAILDCLVEFDKNWQSNYNSQQVDPSAFVSTDDMNRIKKELAEEFKKVFAKVLQANGGYQVVDSAAPDVLVLRPAIINLRVTQPDLMTPGVDMTVIRSAGSMTLYLELWDSMTNTILARAMDAQADQGLGGPQVASSVSNTMAADFILRQWAGALRKALEATRAQSAG
ncbi:MAG: DUF3313 family protein [Steroidobacteraceae bacterium]